MPLVHYNIPRAKRFLTGPDYQSIVDVVPTLVGMKFTMADPTSASFNKLCS